MAEQTLWTSYTPASDNATDAQQYALGTTFYSVASGWVLGVKWRFPNTLPTGSVTAKLWAVTLPDTVQANGTELAVATFVSPVAGAVNEVRFSSPIAITANTIYVVSIKTADRYVVSSNYFTTTVTSGDLRAPQGNTDPLGTGTVFNGKLNTSAGHLFPHQSFSFSNYWVDVIFTTDDPTGTPKSSSDTGTATDAGTLAVAVASTDAGTGTDAQSLLAAITRTETGSFTDAQVVAAAITNTQLGSLTDAQALAVALTNLDTGSLSESQTLLALVSQADTATLSEAATIIAAQSASDTGALAEGWSLVVSHSSSDSATMTEVSGAPTFMSSDSGTLTETQSLAVALTSTDTANFLDTGVRQIEGEAGVRQVPLTIVRRPPSLTMEWEPSAITMKRRAPGLTIKG